MELETQLAVQEQIARGGMVGTFFKATTCPGSTFTVTDELHQFDYATSGRNVTLNGTNSIIGETINWNMSNDRVITSSVVVKDITGTITYSPSGDYSVTEYGVITRTTSIPDKTVIRVTYQWNQPCMDLKTGAPNLSCTSCNGWGAIYPDAGQEITGLFHIPRYKDILLQQGVWRIGDATFTTTSTVDVTTRWVGNRFWGKDKIVIEKITGDIMLPIIRSQDWYVVSPPDTIQIHDTFLATKLQIRLRSQDGD